ncbi:MAG: holliday junction helicase RuvA [Frankiaceae bacterium]|nr:holliday junction helicase RuvA [Frankiaceae bacterium]
MIASVRGRVAAVAPDSAIVEVGGVGLLVYCTATTIAGLRVGDETELATSLMVREDSLTLYGFADADERAIFELLQTASGVGPRLAQAVLAIHRPDGVRRAVATEDLVALMLVPGIGKKGAQRLVLELKDRIGPPTGGAPVQRSGRPADASEQVRAALQGLGYTAREADDAVASVTSTDDPVDDVAALLKASLRALDRR